MTPSATTSENQAAGFADTSLEIWNALLRSSRLIYQLDRLPLTPGQSPDLMKAAAGQAVPLPWYKDVTLSRVPQCLLLGWITVVPVLYQHFPGTPWAFDAQHSYQQGGSQLPLAAFGLARVHSSQSPL